MTFTTKWIRSESKGVLVDYSLDDLMSLIANSQLEIPVLSPSCWGASGYGLTKDFFHGTATVRFVTEAGNISFSVEPTEALVNLYPEGLDDLKVVISLAGDTYTKPEFISAIGLVSAEEFDKIRFKNKETSKIGFNSLIEFISTMGIKENGSETGSGC